ncbi:MAG: hypothetical protein MI723_15445 [Caulobacterales bacterium]|nr:hypothetical protein [Caulobacterales bacterium]
MAWLELGAVPPRALSEAREKLHRAAQWLARMARSYYPPADDDSHTALAFHGPSGAAGLPAIAGGRGDVIPSFIFPEMALALSHDAAGCILGLADMDEAARERAVRDALAEVGLDPARLVLELPYADEVPSAPDSAPDTEQAVELTRYYANMEACLTELSGRFACISPVRLWPHHFDLARLISLDDAADPEAARSIGVGLAPDDSAYDQPYLYIAPWPPNLATDRLPAPAGLRWHQGDFTALVATAEEIMLGPDARARVDAAIDAGVELCRHMLTEARP